MTAASQPGSAVDNGLPPSGILALAVTGFCCFLGVYATQPLLPLFETLFHATKTEAGLTVSAPVMAVALLSPVVGMFADRVSRRSIIVPATMLLALPTLLAATSPSLHTLIFWRFLQGIAVPGIYVTTIAYVTEEAGPAKVGTVMAAFVSGNVVGGLAGRIIVGLVAAHAGWRWAFVVIGVLILLGSGIVWRWLPHSRHFVRRSGSSLPAKEALRFLRTPPLLATYVVGFTLLFELVAAFTYVTYHLSNAPFLLGPGPLSAVFLVYGVGAFAASVSGKWIDRLGSRTVVLASVAMSAAGLALTLIPSLPWIVAGLTVFCSGVFICQPATMSYLRVVAPPSARSLAAGLYLTCYYVGGSVGGVLPAAIWDRAHWHGCVALVIAVQLITIALAGNWWRSGVHAAMEPAAIL